jgi:hypothetical protein
MSRTVVLLRAGLLVAVVTPTIAGPVSAQVTAPPATLAAERLGEPRLLDGRLFYARQGQVPPGPDNRWRIAELPRTGAARDLPHRQADAIRHLDAGRTGPAGGVVLTFSRCGAGGCRVHQVSPSTGRDLLVRRSHQPGASETQPTRWDDAMAWASTKGGAESVYVRDLGHDRPARRIFGPLAKGTHVTGMDIAPRGLAFAVTAPKGEGVDARMYFKPTGRPVRRLQRVTSGALSIVVIAAPQWRGNDVLWTYSRIFGEPRGIVARARVVASGISYAQATVPVTGGTFLSGLAVDPLAAASPLWLRATEQTDDGAGSSTLREYRPGDLRFGPAVAGSGLGH